MRRACRREKVDVRYRTRVEKIEKENGSFRAETPDGTIEAGKILLCTDWAAPQLLAGLGIDLPVTSLPQEAIVTVRTWGEQLSRTQPFVGEVGADAPAGGATWERRPHWEIGADLGLFDLERGAKIAGSGFPVYLGLGSRLQRSLINWFLDVHVTENGFTEVWPPVVVNEIAGR